METRNGKLAHVFSANTCKTDAEKYLEGDVVICLRFVLCIRFSAQPRNDRGTSLSDKEMPGLFLI